MPKVSVWAHTKPMDGWVECQRTLAGLQRKADRLQLEMAELRSELDYLEKQPWETLHSIQRCTKLKKELMRLGLDLADVFEWQIRLNPRLGRS